jgi:hypothetical protein
VRYQSDTYIYSHSVPRLRAFFEPYGFVEDRWEWLVQKTKHNLNDLVGLVSILLERGILASDGQVPLTAEMRENALNSLMDEFPVHKEGELRDRILKMGDYPKALKFTCTLCGSHDLRTKFLDPYYAISTLDAIDLDPKRVDFCHLNDRNPTEYEVADYTDGWEFWCDKCHLVPTLEQHYASEGLEEQLARWLVDNCPQD